MDLKDLPPSFQFMFLSLMKSAIILKEEGFDKEFLVKFAKEMWDTMEMNGVEKMKEIIDGAMKKDLEPHLEKYMKSRKR